MADIKVESYDDSFFLVDKKLKIEIQSAGGEPQFIERKIINDKIDLLVYHSGTAGTSTPVEIIRAVILLKKTQKVIGDYTYTLRYPPNNNGIQPIWDYSVPRKIIITTVNGFVKEIRY